MSIWNEIQELAQENVQRVHALYGDLFPIEVRSVLPSWIEEQVGNPDIDPENPSNVQYMIHFLDALVKEIEIKANSLGSDDDHFLRIKLLGAVTKLKQRYAHEPVSLFRLLRQSLNFERACLSQQNGRGFKSHPTDSDINEQLVFIQINTRQAADLVRQLEQNQEAFVIKCQDRQTLEGIINLYRIERGAMPPTHEVLTSERNFAIQKDQMEADLKQKITDLMKLKTELEEKITATINNLSILQTRVLGVELIGWKREQQLAGNGAPFTKNLDAIQLWCEGIAEIIWQNRKQLLMVEQLGQSDPLAAQSHDTLNKFAILSERVAQLLSQLVTSTFIVEVQPPQVMKTHTAFASTARFLIGGKLNVHMNPAHVKVSIINEEQANKLSNFVGEFARETSGELLNNTGKMEYQPETRHLGVHFRNLQLKQIKRGEKKGAVTVTDEKFCLLYQCQLTIGGKELTYKIWALSLPVVVVVHCSQDDRAWATVVWDNAFGEPGRLPFRVPDAVPWCKMAEALNMKFMSMTGRGLTQDNLHFLAGKLFKPSGTQELLTWFQFCKEPLPGTNFSFWSWFYAIMKLTWNHFPGPWNDGLIIGMVGREQAEELLRKCLAGTFLLRFSDSALGGITISCVNSYNNILSLIPFTEKDLAQKSLAAMINDFKELTYLYPNISKSEVFSKYYIPLPLIDKYVRPEWSIPKTADQRCNQPDAMQVSFPGEGGIGSQELSFSGDTTQDQEIKMDLNAEDNEIALDELDFNLDENLKMMGSCIPDAILDLVD